MNETIFGMSSMTYFIIGIIYASTSINRHHNTSKHDQQDKISLWFLLCIFWIVFILSDIINLNTNYNSNTFIIKKSQIPLSLINKYLIKTGTNTAETILKIPPTYTNKNTLKYIGDINIIQSFTNKTELFQNIIEYHHGFTSLSSIKHNIPEYEISVYLLWDSNKKIIGILTFSENRSITIDLYPRSTLPATFSKI